MQWDTRDVFIDMSQLIHVKYMKQKPDKFKKIKEYGQSFYCILILIMLNKFRIVVSVVICDFLEVKL